MVVLSHLTLVVGFNGNYNSRSLIPFSPSGHLMVLVFFILSGYVIGYSYGGSPDFNITTYLKKRLIRLYPIYFIAIFITISLFSESLWVVFSTLFFGQNLLTANLDHNPALWSLNHEIVYYLLAIPIIKFRIRSIYIFTILSALLIISLFIYSLPTIIEAYCTGFFFWFTGYTLSSVKQNNTDSKPGSARMIASIFLLLACSSLNTFNVYLSKLTLLHSQPRFFLNDIVNAGDFALLPYCLAAVGIAACINSKRLNLLLIIVYLSSWIHLLKMLLNGFLFHSIDFLLPSIFLFVSSFIFLNKNFKKIALRIAPSKTFLYLGSISFALYAIHLPIVFFIKSLHFVSGTLFTFFVRSFTVLTFSILIAHFLEKILQPLIKAKFHPVNSKNVTAQTQICNLSS
ncbi:hypothetical protein BH10BAC3_BH10BAC3_33950 [soil metagenome]